LGTAFTYKLRQAKLGTRGNATGSKRSKESLELLSKQRKGRVVPEELRERISKALTGRVVSDETRKKLSDAARRRYNTQAVKSA
jgi:hypothetical protein